MNLAYGFIETLGLVSAIEAADAMVKAAKVRVIKKQQIGSALVTIIVEGELGACQAAVDAGSAAASRVGTLIAAHVIPRPFDDTVMLVDKFFSPEPINSPAPSITEPPVSAPVKKIKPPKQPKKVNSGADEIRQWMNSNQNGVTLDDIADYLKLDHAAARRMIKRLMDEEKVEKVHQKYFYISKRQN